MSTLHAEKGDPMAGMSNTAGKAPLAIIHIVQGKIECVVTPFADEELEFIVVDGEQGGHPEPFLDYPFTISHEMFRSVFPELAAKAERAGAQE